MKMVGTHRFESFPEVQLPERSRETGSGNPLIRRWISELGNDLIVVGLPESMGVGAEDEGVGPRLLAGLEAGELSVLGTVPGPFSLCFIDRKGGRVLLARDRLGRRRIFFKVDAEGLYWSGQLEALARAALG